LFEQPRVLVAHRHGVDHDLRAFRSDQHDHLEQVASGVRADEQPTVGVFSGVFDRERIVDCVDDVPVGDPCLRAESRISTYLL
jgi:hypothetical protein